MLKRLSLILTVLSCLVFLTTGSVCGQTKIEKYVDKNVAAFLVVDQPAIAIDRLESSIFESQHFQYAMELLSNEQYSLVTGQQIAEVESKIEQIRRLIQPIEKISIIVHSWEDPSIPAPSSDDFSESDVDAEIVQGEEDFPNASGQTRESDSTIGIVEQLADLVAMPAVPAISIVIECCAQTGEQLEREFTNAQTALNANDANVSQSEAAFFERLKKNLGKLKFKKQDNYVLISNVDSASDKLLARLAKPEDRRFRSLSNRRSYQIVKQAIGNDCALRLAFGYADPAKYGLRAETFIDSDLTAFKEPRSLSAAGFQVAWVEDAAALETTEGTYQALIEMDFVVRYTAPVAGLGELIESFRPLGEVPPLPAGVRSLRGECFDPVQKWSATKRIYQQGEADENWQPARLNYFYDSESGGDQPITCFHNGFFDIVPAEHWDEFNSGIQIFHANDGRAAREMFDLLVQAENTGIPESEWIRQIECDYGSHFGKPPVKYDDGHQEYFLNEDWLIAAGHKRMKEVLAEMAGEDQPSTRTFNVLYQAARKRSDEDNTEPFRVLYYNGRSDPENQLTSFEEIRILQLFGNKTDDELANVFQAKPNEMGLRIPIESSGDAVAAIKSLLSYAYQDSFGTSMFLYSAGDNIMHVTGQIFSFNK